MSPRSFWKRDSRAMPTPQFPFGGVPWKHKMLSVMTSRQLGITGSASPSVRRFFAAVALPKQNPFFAKACAALREIHAFSLAFGSVSKLREDLQTPVGFSVNLQPHGVVGIRPAHSTSRNSKKRSQPCLRLVVAFGGPTEWFFRP